MSELRYLNINDLYPHPDNPRKNIGDVTELADSIKANGILQNLTVVPRMIPNIDTGEQEQKGYTVIIGHRRMTAAKQAGLTELPCAVVEMTTKEQLSTMLMENMQRSDLTVYEQAQGFQMMMNLGESVAEIARSSGFSESTVRSRVKLLKLDAEKFKQSEARGATLSDYAELDKIENPALKNVALDAIGTANFRNVLSKAISDDKVKRCMAQWELDLEAFATKIEARGKVGDQTVPMDYVKNFGYWNKSDMVEIPKDYPEVKYYYRVSEIQIDLYKESKQLDSQAASETERLRAEQKAAEERKRAEFEEITDRHFELRHEFIAEFCSAKKCIPAICEFVGISMLANTGYTDSFDFDVDLLNDLLGMDIDEDIAIEEIRSACAQSFADDPGYALLAITYSGIDDDRNGYWYDKWDYDAKRYLFVHQENQSLDRLYDFLISIGYEMSDEEKEMRSGTHELFDKPAE